MKMNEAEAQISKRRSALQATCGQAELLVGTCHYACGHRFNWILDYVLQRTGIRSPDTHDCPKCTIDPVCLICLCHFDANASNACQKCDCFFSKSLLATRRDKLEQMGVSVVEHKATTFVKCKLEFEKKRLRKRGILLQ